ncbi:Endolytic murein transglycosylase [Candidatus Desulfarcum epimagneticum]|uniref:Endolytic murein transglycosylase n=1 Tax=uncultured Desulfobacteraceae bacterium TaxID=218296 RepID=A0A484HNS6_9BACT|nr:Endolytic murein transglycosylase [uncultured Desulfobacteraceae bacterium]
MEAGKIWDWLSMALFAVFALIFFFLLSLAIYAERPAGAPGKSLILVVEPGRDFGSAVSEMARRGIVKRPLAFKALAFLKGDDKQIKAGEYALGPSMTPSFILGELVRGRGLLRRLTIPEGQNMRQIASLAARAGVCGEKEFMDAAVNPSLAAEMGVDAETFEGYLFPDTYFFPRDTAPAALIAAMVRRFRSVFSPEWEERARSLGFSVHQVVTLASIIEKETGAAPERPVISSVFHNRLKKNMRLESDPTVIYGIRDFDGNLTRRHLKEPAPHNTYVIRGLPPGPIASPGLESLRAALYPADTDFLFFVSKNDGFHQFSATLREHEKAVFKHQKRRRRRAKIAP